MTVDMAILPFFEDLPRKITVFDKYDIVILPFLEDLPRKITTFYKFKINLPGNETESEG